MKLFTSLVIILLVLGLIAFGAIKYFDIDVELFDTYLQETSDASSELVKITGAGDAYAGYFVLRSRKLKQQARRAPASLNVVWVDDGADYRDRVHKLEDGVYDYIVMPVSEWLVWGKYDIDENGRKQERRNPFPGVIVSVLAESRGADVMLGFGNVVTGNVKDLDPSLSYAYIPGTPSETLLNSMIANLQLDIPEENRIKVESEDDLIKLADQQGADVFITWEPLATRLRTKHGMLDVWSSKEFRGYIKDVLIWNRDRVGRDKEHIARFLGAYFRTLGLYSAQRSQLIADMKKSYSDLSQQEIERLIGTVEFVDVHENATQEFGVEENSAGQLDNGLMQTIDDCIVLQLQFGNLESEPIDDPAKLVKDDFIAELATKRSQVFASARLTQTEWMPLADAEWNNLQDGPLLRLRPVTFHQHTAKLTDIGVETVDTFARQLKQTYPGFRIKVIGHTRSGGDPEILLDLSKKRAEAVIRRLITVHNIDADRMHAYGMGGNERPAYKLPGRNRRERMQNMARVEFKLVASGQSL